MISNGSVDEIVRQPVEWKHQKLITSLKQLHGKLFIDVRKWLPLGKDDEMRPSKGITLSIDDWIGAMEDIKEMRSRHSSTQK